MVAAYDNESQAVVYETQILEVSPEPKVVLIEVKIDWTEERIKKEIRDTFPEDPETAIKIARCESNLNPNAVGPTNDHGIFQIHVPSHGHRIGGIDLYNPGENIAFARKLYEERGWLPWVCFTKKMIY